MGVISRITIIITPIRGLITRLITTLNSKPLYPYRIPIDPFKGALGEPGLEDDLRPPPVKRKRRSTRRGVRAKEYGSGASRFASKLRV